MSKYIKSEARKSVEVSLKKLETAEVAVSKVITDFIGGRSMKIVKASLIAVKDEIKANLPEGTKCKDDENYLKMQSFKSTVCKRLQRDFEKTPNGKKAKAKAEKEAKAKAENAKSEKEAKIIQDAIDSGSVVATETALETTEMSFEQVILFAAEKALLCQVSASAAGIMLSKAIKAFK